MADGIGSTTVASIHRLVRMYTLFVHQMPDFRPFHTALYHSRDTTLPDFSKTTDTDGELFFDVRFPPCFFPFGIHSKSSSDGTTSLLSYSMSKCGQHFAYGISNSVRIVLFYQIMSDTS